MALLIRIEGDCDRRKDKKQLPRTKTKYNRTYSGGMHVHTTYLMWLHANVYFSLISFTHAKCGAKYAPYINDQKRNWILKSYKVTLHFQTHWQANFYNCAVVLKSKNSCRTATVCHLSALREIITAQKVMMQHFSTASRKKIFKVLLVQALDCL